MNKITNPAINRAETINYREILLPAHAMWFARAESLDIYCTQENGERISEKDFAILECNEQELAIHQIQKQIQDKLQLPAYEQIRKLMILTDVELLNFTIHLKLHLSDIAHEEKARIFIKYLEGNIINATTIYQHQYKIQGILNLIETHEDLNQYSRRSKERFITSVGFLKQLEKFIPAPVIQKDPDPVIHTNPAPVIQSNPTPVMQTDIDPFCDDDPTLVDIIPRFLVPDMHDVHYRSYEIPHKIVEEHIPTVITNKCNTNRSLISRILQKFNIM